jgi:hypothetical protein
MIFHAFRLMIVQIVSFWVAKLRSPVGWYQHLREEFLFVLNHKICSYDNAERTCNRQCHEISLSEWIFC